jgi:hypothetical protein
VSDTPGCPHRRQASSHICLVFSVILRLPDGLFRQVCLNVSWGLEANAKASVIISRHE